MGIFEHLWPGALLARFASPLRIAICVTLGLIALHLLFGVARAQAAWHFLDSAYIGLMLWLLLYGGQRADADLAASELRIDESRWRRRGPSLFAARVETTLAFTIGLALAVISWLVMEADAQAAPGPVDPPGAHRAVIFLRWILDGALLFHLGAMILRHRRWLNDYIAEDLEIDLLHVDRLTVLSNAFVMWLALLAGLVTVPLVLFTFLKDANPYEQLRLLAALVLGLLVAVLLFTPILRTRGRLIEARDRERSAAIEGLRDGPIRCGALAFRGDGEHYSATELLGYLEFLDSIWEWPIRRNLARISFYALIPPLAWVLSALTEITLSGQLE